MKNLLLGFRRRCAWCGVQLRGWLRLPGERRAWRDAEKRAREKDDG